MASSDHYHIRPPDFTRDLESLAQAQISAFGHNHWPFWQKGHGRLAGDFVGAMGALGNINYVAEDTATGRVVGFVFAGYPLSGSSIRQAIGPIGKLLGFGLIGLPVWKGEAFRHAARFLPAMYQLMKVHPSHDPHAEIIEFAVHEEAQGKGVGKLLMNAAVNDLHRRGAKQVVLLTDSTMSWKFYERYGYCRVRGVDFGDTYEVATGSKSEHGYSYELDVSKKAAELKAAGILI